MDFKLVLLICAAIAVICIKESQADSSSSESKSYDDYGYPSWCSRYWNKRCHRRYLSTSTTIVSPTTNQDFSSSGTTTGTPSKTAASISTIVPTATSTVVSTTTSTVVPTTSSTVVPTTTISPNTTPGTTYSTTPSTTSSTTPSTTSSTVSSP